MGVPTTLSFTSFDRHEYSPNTPSLKVKKVCAHVVTFVANHDLSTGNFNTGINSVVTIFGEIFLKGHQQGGPGDALLFMSFDASSRSFESINNDFAHSLPGKGLHVCAVCV